jgi:hypothetical protein
MHELHDDTVGRAWTPWRWWAATQQTSCWEVLWGVRELYGASGWQRDERRAAARNVATHDIAAYNGHDVIVMAHMALQKQNKIIFCFFLLLT